MSTVDEIKSAIDKLSPQERFELDVLLYPSSGSDLDRQMQTDGEELAEVQIGILSRTSIRH